MPEIRVEIKWDSKGLQLSDYDIKIALERAYWNIKFGVKEIEDEPKEGNYGK